VIGGAAPISVQTMTKTQTEDVSGTLAQIERAAAAGADIVRVTVRHPEAGLALREIVRGSPGPIVADVHYDARAPWRRWRRGSRASGSTAANIHRARPKVADIARRGEGPGRPDADRGQRRQHPRSQGAGARPRGQRRRDRRAEWWRLPWAHPQSSRSWTFHRSKVSLKASDVATNLAANRKFAALDNRYPLHLGLTERARSTRAALRARSASAFLLAEGIGDTIRVSLVGEPEEEVRVAARSWPTSRTSPTDQTSSPAPPAGASRSTCSRWSSGSRRPCRAIRRTMTVSVMGLAS